MMNTVPDNSAPPLIDSIAGRLLRIIFGCYFVVTLVVTTVQLAAEYRHTETRLKQEIQAMQQTFGSGISDALWRFDNDILSRILSGMKALPVVVGVKVEDAEGRIVMAVGKIQGQDGQTLLADPQGRLNPTDDQGNLFARLFSQTFPARYADTSGEIHMIGQWTVYSDQRIIMRQVEYGFYLILVNSIVKTLALWFIFLFIIQRWLGKPLRQLTDFVGQLHIGNLGDKVFVLKDHGRHELHLLTNKLNEMLGNLRTSVKENEALYAQLQAEQTEIRKLNETLEHRVAERTEELQKDRQQLAQANQQLTQMNQELASALKTLSLTQDELVRSEKLAALGSLVTGVAHELNTPLGNSLLTASTLADKTSQLARLCSNDVERTVVKRYLDDALYACDILLRNIERAANLVTSFKQVAVDQSSSQRRRFSLAAVVAENITMLEPQMKNTPFRVEQDIPEGIMLDSYPGPLGQVIVNLVNNSLLHGFEGRGSGTIWISGRQLDTATVELTVRDNGVGISPENLKRIYDPFFTTKLGAGGSGLGLHIAHNIVTSVLGGKIQAESERNSGTTFILTLAMVAPHVNPNPTPALN